MHTSQVSKCAHNTAKEQVRAYKKRGYTGIIITDHFVNGWCHCPADLPWEKKMEFLLHGYEEAKEEGRKCGLDVFLGWEYFDNGSDYLTYGLDKDFLIKHPQLINMKIEEYSPLVRKHGGFIAQAHPYRDTRPGRNYGPAAPQLLDAVEVYNPTDPDENNNRANDFARLHGLPVQSGSDSHRVNIAFASGIRVSKKAENIFDIINAIKMRQVECVLP